MALELWASIIILVKEKSVAELVDGFFAAGKWLAAGGALAIGSDSNLRISVSEELRLLEFGERLNQQRRNVLANNDHTAGERLYLAAAEAGGRALGQPVGQIAEGFRADLVELKPEHPLMSGCGEESVLDAYVFAGDNSMIRSVLVAGDVIIRDGHHQHGEELAARFSRVMAELS